MQVHVINEAKGGEVVPETEQRAEAQMRQSMKQAETECMKVVDDTRTVPLCANVPSRTVMIGTEVSKEEEDRLLQFLHHNQDVFAWSKLDLTGVHRSVIEHALNTDLKVRPKLQRQRPMSDDRVKSAEAEVQKLLDARIKGGAVPSMGGQCCDGTEEEWKHAHVHRLHRAQQSVPERPLPTPKDRYHHRSGSWLRNVKFARLFLWVSPGVDAKGGRGQNRFTTPFGIFRFVRMPEGLRNVRPTFNRMMKLILGSQWIAMLRLT
jgi:hypothetical protein